MTWSSVVVNWLKPRFRPTEEVLESGSWEDGREAMRMTVSGKGARGGLELIMKSLTSRSSSIVNLIPWNTINDVLTACHGRPFVSTHYVVD
jgi:hypothetical protein